MNEYYLTKTGLAAFLDQLIRDYEVLAPVMENGLLNFQQVRQGKAVTLNISNTVKPPKEFFFPQTECLFCASCEDQQHGLIEPPAESLSPRVLFGVRPCDARSFYLLDQVFLGNVTPDPYYAERRARTLVVAIGCDQPGQACFCSSVGGNPFDDTGSDLMLIEADSGYLVKGTSLQGEEFLAHYRPFFEEPSELVKARAQKIVRETQASMPAIFDVSMVTSQLRQAVAPEFWDQVYEKCVGCSICAYLCPTCHCFDITDEVIASDTVRLRTWDACASSYFTLEASGFNPRPTQKERVKNRFMHKFAYFPENFAQIGCVGCGRCVRDCPVNLDIRQVLLDITDLEKPELR